MDIFTTQTKIYIEKFSEMGLKGKTRLWQLTGIDTAEILVPVSNPEISSLWSQNNHCKRLHNYFGASI